MLTLSLALAPLTALAGPPPMKAFVVGAAADGVPSRRPAYAKVGEPITLYTVVKRGRRYYTDAPLLRVGRRTLKRRHLRSLGALGKAVSVRWRRVEPRLHHTSTPPPNEGNPAYSNCVLFGARHGKWLGFDTIEYATTPISKATGSRHRVHRATPSDRRLARNRGAGTMRYAVDVTVDGMTVSSPGIEAVGRTGITEDVMRVGYRTGDGLVGWLTNYYNVPNLFGSAGDGRRHQTDRFQGADCADVIVGAARIAGARIDYTHAAGLFRYARPTTGLLSLGPRGLTDAKGAPVVLRYGKDVKPGDIILIDYAGMDATRRKWDHTGVLGADAGVSGVLDPEDPLLHMAYLVGLKAERLGRHSPATIQVLRLKRRVERAIQRKQAPRRSF